MPSSKQEGPSVGHQHTKYSSKRKALHMDPYGPFGLRGEGGGVEGSRVKLAENRLILGQLYYTPPLSPSIQTDHKGPCVELFS